MQKVKAINHENFALYKHFMLLIYNILVEKAKFLKNTLFFFLISLSANLYLAENDSFSFTLLETIFFFFVFQLLLFSGDLYMAQILEECNEKAFKHLNSYKLFIFQADSISNQMSIYIWSLKKAQRSF